MEVSGETAFGVGASRPTLSTSSKQILCGASKNVLDVSIYRRDYGDR